MSNHEPREKHKNEPPMNTDGHGLAFATDKENLSVRAIFRQGGDS
jgi:hypothetical protein